MEISVSEKEYCKLEVQYEADADQIENKRVEVLSLFKKAPIPGFRKGKANVEIIKIHYKKQIEESLKRALAEEAFHNTLFEKNIKPLGQPNFSSILLQGNKFNCEFSLNKSPDFELGKYKELELPKPPRTVSVNELTEKMLEDLRTQYGEMVPYTDTDFVEVGDKIILTYTGSIDGKIDEAISSMNGELLNVGTNSFKEFDDNLLGMTVNQPRDFNITVTNGLLPSYNGKTVNFSVNVSMGSKTNKMPLDDSLALKVGRNTFQELREFVQNTANVKLEESDRNAMNHQVGAQLVASHEFKVPEWLTLSEAQYLAAHSQKQWDTLIDEDKETFLKLADTNVKLALILEKIRENEPEAQLSDQEVVEMIKQNIAKSSPNNIDEVLQNMNKNGYLSVLVVRLRDEFTLDFIVKNAKILE